MTPDATDREGRGVATGPTLNPQVIGQAENALRALLERTLAGTGLEYRHWIALTLTVGNEVPVGEGELVARVAGVLKVDATTARESIADLRARKLVESLAGDESQVQPTDAGRKVHREIRSVIGEIVKRIFQGISVDDLETAGRVLILITARADAELAGA